MYRFLLRPRWIGFHLLVLAAVVLMVNLGFWQLRRLDERREFNATVTERIEQGPVPLDAVLDEAGDDPESVEWRQVTASGSYLPDQILVFNRSQGGRPGDNVVTPLELDDGRIVLVNRGFVPLGLDVPPAPTTPVEVLGRARPSEERRRGQLTDAADGPVTEVRRLEIERIAPQLPGEVVPVYVDLVLSEPPAGPDDPTPVPAPELDEGPHLSYAVQWFIFAACVVVGWVLAVRRSVRSRRTHDPDRDSVDVAARATPGTDDEPRPNTAPTHHVTPGSAPRTDEAGGGAATGAATDRLTGRAAPGTGADRRSSGDDAATTAPRGTPGSSPR